HPLRLRRQGCPQAPQLLPAGGTGRQVLLHQGDRVGTGRLVSIQGQQVPDHVTAHFHLAPPPIVSRSGFWPGSRSHGPSPPSFR
ncbi:Cysteine-rich VLP domain-containing protein, partial [Dysosmobacter welbionis]